MADKPTSTNRPEQKRDRAILVRRLRERASAVRLQVADLSNQAHELDLAANAIEAANE